MPIKDIHITGKILEFISFQKKGWESCKKNYARWHIFRTVSGMQPCIRTWIPGCGHFMLDITRDGKYDGNWNENYWFEKQLEKICEE